MTNLSFALPLFPRPPSSVLIDFPLVADYHPDMVQLKTTLGTFGFELAGSSLSRVELRPRGNLTPPVTPDEKRVAKALLDCVNGSAPVPAVTFVVDEEPEFQRKVLLACARIPRGKVVTYGQLARQASRPRAARAVGRVMATNPLSIVIPCHRVVASDGSLHGYGGGLATKKKLLELEGVEFEGMKVRE